MDNSVLSKTSRTKLVLLGACIALVLVGVALIVVKQKNAHPVVKKATPTVSDTPTTVTTVCTDDIITRANPYLRDDNKAQLLALVKEIQNKPGYEGDVNCNYIIATTALLVGNVKDAEHAILRMHANRQNKASLSNAFVPPAVTETSLQLRLDAIKSIQKSVQSGMQLQGAPR
ncbi:MAG TPA: hypothetical protein PLT04_01560 [Candidatus Saccharibacteria bacterium]|nr:hypothetical protein [Candidatus Saccharibacteria bacterium]